MAVAWLLCCTNSIVTLVLVCVVLVGVGDGLFEVCSLICCFCCGCFAMTVWFDCCVVFWLMLLCGGCFGWLRCVWFG